MTKLKALPEHHADTILGWITDTDDSAAIELAEARQRLLRNFDIELRHDSQLSRWRDWYLRRKQLQAQNTFVEFVSEAVAEGMPALNHEQLRDFQLRGLALLAENADAEVRLAFAKELRQGMEAQTKRLQAETQRDRFEFDAAKAALAALPALRAINANKALDDRSRVDEARKALFGVTPK